MTDLVLAGVYDALRAGRWAEARTRCREALAGQPASARLHHALGLAFCGEEGYAEAATHLERARQLDPQTLRWSRDLGLVYAVIGRWSACVDALLPWAASLDDQAIATLLIAATESCRAADVLEALAENRPALPETSAVRHAYGTALMAAGRGDEAEAVLLDALRAEDIPALHDAIAELFERTGRSERAWRHREAHARLQPASGAARLRFARACADRGLWAEARQARLEAVRLGLETAADRSASVLVALSEPEESASTLRELASGVFRERTRAEAPRPERVRHSRPERMRVGYISGEFRATPSLYFCRAFLAHHDRRKVELFFFSTTKRPDSATDAWRRWSDHWRDVSTLSDAELIARLRDDDLSVLVDLSGHLPENRLPALCERIAPVQLTYPNYPGTTGCPGIDVLLTDSWTSPIGTEAEYSEQLYRLPSGHLKFAPPDVPEPAAQRTSTDQNVTFGIFQRLSKLHGGVWDAVAGILSRVPGSRLLLHCGDAALDDPHSETAAHVRRCLSDRSVDPARVRLVGPRAYPEHLALVSSVDVALDTFPYGGQTTTCHCLWMGVPVVTLRAPSHAGRISAALLTRAGRGEWVAESVDEYQDTAVTLASDRSYLALLRRSLRQEVVAAGLTDGATLARELEDAYAALCAAPASSHAL